VIASISSPVRVGGRSTIKGSGFSAGAKVNFFAPTAAGIINDGPLTPAVNSPLTLTVSVPANIPLGDGVVALQVIDTDLNYAASNIKMAQLFGSAALGIPTLSAINGVGLAASSLDPAYARDNVETTVARGGEVVLQGEAFDSANGVAIDVFCACPGGKVGPFFIDPGDPRLSPTSISLILPAAGAGAPPAGPAAFVVSNKGIDGSFGKKSNAVAVPIGQRVHVMSVTQEKDSLIVDGTGMSVLTVINFFDTKRGAVVNLGGLDGAGRPVIPITLVSDTEVRFTIPAGAVPGRAYVQAINPPFVPFASSGSDPGGAFILAAPTPAPAPTPSAVVTATGGFRSHTPKATPSPSTPTPGSTGLPTATPTAAAEAYQVLFTGGMDNTVTATGSRAPLASAELYDERTGQFTATSPMAYARLGHSSTVLNNGTVLIAGGRNAWSARPGPSAELYDIRSGTFSFTGSMNSPRLSHIAMLLKGGKVLVAGGENLDFAAIDLAEIYDPGSGLFTPTASMLRPRIGPAAAMLKDGTVLIAGGADDNGLLASAELFDPAGAGSVAVGSMNVVRQGATATLLPNGAVLVAGGASQTPGCIRCATATAEIFNPLTRSFALTGRMHAARRGHTATLLLNGTVLITGGQDDAQGTVWSSTEIYDPANGIFSEGANMNFPRAEHAAALLASGKVLVAGGFTGPTAITRTAEIFDPATGKFTMAGNMMSARAAYGMGCFSMDAAHTASRNRLRAISLPSNGKH